MVVDEVGRASVTLTLDVEELALFNNALNEVCNGVADLAIDAEFATRLGTSRTEARRLLDEIRAALDRAEWPPDQRK